MRRHSAVLDGRSTAFVALAALAGFPALIAAAFGQSPSSDRAQPDTPPAPPRTVATAIQIANLPLGVVTFPNGKAMNLTVALGSAAFRHPKDPPGRLWLMTDRGPSIPCVDAKRMIGIEPEQACPADRNGRIYPLAGFVPSIYAVDIGQDQVARINVFVPFKGKSGRPVSGRPNAAGGNGRAEGIFATDGRALPPDPSGIDPEAFIRLQDGSYWVAEEFGPSLLEVAPDGTVRRRLVPSNAAADFKDADYEIVPNLPPIMRQKGQNRGFEGLAVSPDEKFLYVMMQSPLANPDVQVLQTSRNVRLWKIERETGAIAGQFFYQLDMPAAFRADREGRERSQQDVHVSEIVALRPDRLLILERIDKTSRLFIVALDEANRVPPEFDSAEMNPSLEALSGETLALRGLKPLPKILILDTDSVPGLPAKIEGVAVMAPDELILVNDNDFGIDGVRTQMFRVTLPAPVLR
ncbi:esterase-like activity of phytase family protein [Rhabdaerophilum sp. SD176]|uniref:esterase-like activity of phytase family protein n=1 Tax=Rhabdaerophilum sp. SD176 TaxID=2983548 RepID=UPI0024E00DE8|nr:esterase-like activity of phytase family protein [Rhabdaerophilum sp. SD176]